jgi:hypothetical protein
MLRGFTGASTRISVDCVIARCCGAAFKRPHKTAEWKMYGFRISLQTRSSHDWSNAGRLYVFATAGIAPSAFNYAIRRVEIGARRPLLA